MQKSHLRFSTAFIFCFLGVCQSATAQFSGGGVAAVASTPEFSSAVIVSGLDTALYGAFSEANRSCYRPPARLTADDIVLGTTREDVDRANQEDRLKCNQKELFPNAFSLEESTLKCHELNKIKSCQFWINELLLNITRSYPASGFINSQKVIANRYIIRSKIRRQCVAFLFLRSKLFRRNEYEWGFLSRDSSFFKNNAVNKLNTPRGYNAPVWSNNSPIYCN